MRGVRVIRDRLVDRVAFPIDAGVCRYVPLSVVCGAFGVAATSFAMDRALARAHLGIDPFACRTVV